MQDKHIFKDGETAYIKVTVSYTEGTSQSNLRILFPRSNDPNRYGLAMRDLNTVMAFVSSEVLIPEADLIVNRDYSITGTKDIHEAMFSGATLINKDGVKMRYSEEDGEVLQAQPESPDVWLHSYVGYIDSKNDWAIYESAPIVEE